VLASLPFAPEVVLHSLRSMLERYPEVLSQDRLASGFNPTLADADGRAWVSAGHYGLDQGIVLMMIENHRSERIWQLTCANPYLRTGLLEAGFRGGWLSQSSGGRKC
jgi:hypothetical protein